MVSVGFTLYVLGWLMHKFQSTFQTPIVVDRTLDVGSGLLMFFGFFSVVAGLATFFWRYLP